MFSYYNIYSAIDVLHAIQKNGKLSQQESDFVNHILQGDEGKKGLYALARHCVIDDVRAIANQLEEQVKSIPLFHFSYKSAIKRTLSMVKTLLEKQNHKVSNLKGREQNYDDIYHQTSHVYQGVLVVPIIQTLDYRLGTSPGECSGYVAEWALCILNKKNPFGINHRFAPLFKSVPFSSIAGKKYADLNHCVVLTNQIAKLQAANQKQQTSVMSTCANQNTIYHHAVSLRQIYLDVSDIAQKLLSSANEYPANVYYLAIHRNFGGHALGFFQDENKTYHFFDVNSGWYKFQDADRFTKWLAFYFNMMNYHTRYTDYSIQSFSLKKRTDSFSMTQLVVTNFKNGINKQLYYSRETFNHARMWLSRTRKRAVTVDAIQVNPEKNCRYQQEHSIK